MTWTMNPASQSATTSAQEQLPEQTLQFPLETDIVIRIDGTVVIADMPVELRCLYEMLSGEISSDERSEEATAQIVLTV